MFRITRHLQEVLDPQPLGPHREPPGPVVIWNLIRRCNLTCKHCYSSRPTRIFRASFLPTRSIRSWTICAPSACRC